MNIASTFERYSGLSTLFIFEIMLTTYLVEELVRFV